MLQFRRALARHPRVLETLTEGVEAKVSAAPLSADDFAAELAGIQADAREQSKPIFAPFAYLPAMYGDAARRAA
jgi:hypothetical protein